MSVRMNEVTELVSGKIHTWPENHHSKVITMKHVFDCPRIRGKSGAIGVVSVKSQLTDSRSAAGKTTKAAICACSNPMLLCPAQYCTLDWQSPHAKRQRCWSLWQESGRYLGVTRTSLNHWLALSFTMHETWIQRVKSRYEGRMERQEGRRESWGKDKEMVRMGSRKKTCTWVGHSHFPPGVSVPPWTTPLSLAPSHRLWRYRFTWTTSPPVYAQHSGLKIILKDDWWNIAGNRCIIEAGHRHRLCLQRKGPPVTGQGIEMV